MKFAIRDWRIWRKAVLAKPILTPGGMLDRGTVVLTRGDHLWLDGKAVHVAGMEFQSSSGKELGAAVVAMPNQGILSELPLEFASDGPPPKEYFDVNLWGEGSPSMARITIEVISPTPTQPTTYEVRDLECRLLDGVITLTGQCSVSGRSRSGITFLGESSPIGEIPPAEDLDESISLTTPKADK